MDSQGRIQFSSKVAIFKIVILNKFKLEKIISNKAKKIIATNLEIVLQNNKCKNNLWKMLKKL